MSNLLTTRPLRTSRRSCGYIRSYQHRSPLCIKCVCFIYLGFYVAFTTVQVKLPRVVLLAEETSTYSWSQFCTVNGIQTHYHTSERCQNSWTSLPTEVCVLCYQVRLAGLFMDINFNLFRIGLLAVTTVFTQWFWWCAFKYFCIWL